MTPRDAFLALPRAHDDGRRPGIASICSAHPLVIEAALIEARDAGAVPCIEATCNQVNQDGGYTGMSPAEFRGLVFGIADRVGVPHDAILLGGDHLGPNPWRDRMAEKAMEKAVAMTHAYAAAGFAKIHLDASMSCADDPVPLPGPTVAARAARLARAAEDGAAAGGHNPPAYIVGTEVPVPGGAADALDHVTVTGPDDAATTVQQHEQAFAEAGLADATTRIVALVVQPGVEFGQTEIHRYAPDQAQPLTDWRAATGGLVFEAHSTDYQTPRTLARLVRDGFAILKVGPGLTFALREALYALDAIAGEIVPDYATGTLPAAMETAMEAHPSHWRPYVHGTEIDQHTQRHFGLSDRIRYLWPDAGATAAVDALMRALGPRDVPWPLISQHLGRLADPVADGAVAADARALLIAAVRQAIAPYTAACKEG